MTQDLDSLELFDDRSLPFEDRLWAAAEKLRGRVGASQYRHYILTIIFLKYVSDRYSRSESERRGYIAVPPVASWAALSLAATEGRLLTALDIALEALERANPHLRSVFSKDLFAASGLAESRVNEIFRLFDSVDLWDGSGGDIFGKVHEYFLAHFALTEGQRGGEFFTPFSVVSLLVEMLAPFGGRVYDPCCGAGGMFVHSAGFITAHGKAEQEISIFGQESNPTTWALARMNLAARGLRSHLGAEAADTLRHDLHPSLKADYILANPPFNMSDWGRSELVQDPRFPHGLPPQSNANFAWLQHIIFHLDNNGVAGVVLSNGSLSASAGGEGEIRESIVNSDIVDCIVALPDRLFYSTQISVCIWILAKNKGGDVRYRRRTGEVLFLDARRFGTMISRVHRVFDTNEIELLARTYHAWRGDSGSDDYRDQGGFAAVATLDEIKRHRYALVPGRYVGFSPSELPDVKTVRRDLRELRLTLGDTTERAKTAIAILEELANG